MSDIDDISYETFLKVRYETFLMDLKQMIEAENTFRDLKFVLKNVIPEGKLEQMKSPLDVFTALEQRCLLGPDKLDVLRKYLEVIGRPNLIEMLDEYENPSSTTIFEDDGYKASIRINASVFGPFHFGSFNSTLSIETYPLRHPELTLVNKNNDRCKVEVLLNGRLRGFLFSSPDRTIRLELLPKQTKTIRLSVEGMPLFLSDSFFVKVNFIRERADMKITCAVSGSNSQVNEVVTCSNHVTDVEFREMVSQVFGDASATVMINKCRPLGNSGAKLVDYGIRDGSRVDVILGGTGGAKREGFGFGMKKNESFIINFKWRAGATTLEDKSKEQFWGAQSFLSDPVGNGLGFGMKTNGSSKTGFKWRAEATTLEDKSNEQFRDADNFPTDSSKVTTVRFRLVVRGNKMPSAGNGCPTSLKRGTPLAYGYDYQN